MKSENSITVSFPGKSVNEALARAIVGAFASGLDPTMEELADMKTAVSEAVSNSIIHGYPEETGEIRLTCIAYPGRLLEIEVRDWGVGIPDVRKARTPMFTTGGTERSGMGFTIMEKFMSSLKVESKPGEGTIVTMTRKLSGGTGT